MVLGHEGYYETGNSRQDEETRVTRNVLRAFQLSEP